MNTEQERAELLPCPFCGESENLIVQHCEGTIIHPAYRIYCDNCGGSNGYTDRADHVENWNRRAALQSQEYTAAIGEAGQAYLDRFKNAHALPAEFRWRELWAVMCVAANKGRTDALQSQAREDAFIDGVLLGLQVITGSGNAGNAEHDELIRCAGVDLVVRRAIEQEMWELAGLDRNQISIDHARRIEGGGSHEPI